MARDQRRRRVLNEELRSASGAFASSASTSAAAGADAPRYGEQAGVEHHPQITDFIPRRKRAVLTTLAVGVGVAAGTQFVAQNSATLAAVMPGVPAREVAGQLAHGVAAWVAAVGLLLVAALARIIYSLRRHRVDDVRGRYRVWRWIAAGSIIASLNAIVGAHQLLARAAAAVTGWSLTTSANEWWLAPLALLAGWIGVRLVLEIAESRAALGLAALAGMTYAVAAAAALGWVPAALGVSAGALAGALPLVGHTLALAAMMVFARYVVLDVQGLIEHKPRRPAASAASAASAAKARRAAAKTAETTAATTPVATPAASAAAAKAASTAKPDAAASSWTDDDEDDAEENTGDRRLSKAERKRLRKLRQGRAA
jgi:hypothetical protein